MKLCSYVMTNDAGFAPNPFWGYCTLAACTPNHMRCVLGKDDWIVGNGSAGEGNLLIYAMRVSERLDLNAYYHDPRFAQKKPSNAGWRERCGDNIYFHGAEGNLVQDAAAVHHNDCHVQEQDIYGDRVFISDHFFYFGEDAPPFPPQFASLICTGRGVRYHEGPVVDAFIDWLERTHPPQSVNPPGLFGLPRDREDS